METESSKQLPRLFLTRGARRDACGWRAEGKRDLTTNDTGVAVFARQTLQGKSQNRGPADSCRPFPNPRSKSLLLSACIINTAISKTTSAVPSSPIAFAACLYQYTRNFRKARALCGANSSRYHVRHGAFKTRTRRGEAGAPATLIGRAVRTVDFSGPIMTCRQDPSWIR